MGGSMKSNLILRLDPTFSGSRYFRIWVMWRGLRTGISSSSCFAIIYSCFTSVFRSCLRTETTSSSSMCYSFPEWLEKRSNSSFATFSRRSTTNALKDWSNYLNHWNSVESFLQRRSLLLLLIGWVQWAWRSLLTIGSEINDDCCDIISRKTDFLPYLWAHFDQSFSCCFDISPLRVWDYESHHFLVLEILPNTVRGYNDKSVLGSDVRLAYFRDSSCPCTNAGLIAKRTRHGQAWHIYLLHPYPQRT